MAKLPSLAIRWANVSWGACWLCSMLLGVGVGQAHTVEGFIIMGLQNFESPFGFDETETYTEVWGAGDLAFLGSLGSGVAIIDVAEPRDPLTIAEFGTDLEASFHDVRTAGDVGFFSTQEKGTFVVDISDPTDPQELARVASATQGFDSVSNAAVHGQFLLQVSGTSAEIAVTNISSPAAPEFVTKIDTGDTVGVHDLTVVDNRLYAAGLGGSNGQGATYVYDISKLGTDGAVKIGEVPTGTDTASVWPNSDHTTLIVTHRKAGGGVAAWDISNLSEPQLIETADATDFGFNAFSAGAIHLTGQTAYVAWHQAGVQVLDLNLLNETGIIFRTAAFRTSQASPLEKFVGNTSVFHLDEERVLLSDTRWGLYVIDGSEVFSESPPIVPPPNLEVTCAAIAAGEMESAALTSTLTALNLIAGDADQNGEVDFLDFLALARSFGQNDVGYAGGDFDCNGEVAFLDFLILGRNFGSGTVSAVPEPKLDLCLLVVFVAFLLAIRQANRSQWQPREGRCADLVAVHDCLNRSMTNH